MRLPGRGKMYTNLVSTTSAVAIKINHFKIIFRTTEQPNWMFNFIFVEKNIEPHISFNLDQLSIWKGGNMLSTVYLFIRFFSSHRFAYLIWSECAPPQFKSHKNIMEIENHFRKKTHSFINVRFHADDGCW